MIKCFTLDGEVGYPLNRLKHPEFKYLPFQSDISVVGLCVFLYAVYSPYIGKDSSVMGSYSESLNGLTKLVVKYILNRGTSLSISYRCHQIHSQLILWF